MKKPKRYPQFPPHLILTNYLLRLKTLKEYSKPFNGSNQTSHVAHLKIIYKHIRQTSKSHTNLQTANKPVFCLAQLVLAKSTVVTKAALWDTATVTQMPPTVAKSHVYMLMACRIYWD